MAESRLISIINLPLYHTGEQGGLVLIPALTVENKKIVEFLVDLTLPTHLFEAIFRCAYTPS